MWYIVTLRFDAIRYARTINGVRRRFYNNARLDTRDELAIRGLPRTITKPHCFEKLTFGGIVCSFATLNSSYIALAVWNTVHNKFTIIESIIAFADSYGLPLPMTGLATGCADAVSCTTGSSWSAGTSTSRTSAPPGTTRSASPK